MQILRSIAKYDCLVSMDQDSAICTSVLALLFAVSCHLLQVMKSFSGIWIVPLDLEASLEGKVLIYTDPDIMCSMGSAVAHLHLLKIALNIVIIIILFLISLSINRLNY